MKRSLRSGFTLIELLLVIAIVSVLIGMLFPVFAQARKQSRMASCTSNLRQLHMAMSLYTDDHGQAPNPLQFVRSLDNRRLLFCPEDGKPDSAASSYVFRSVVPPDFKPIWEQSSVDPNVVLVTCNQHLEQRETVNGEDRRVSEPHYPFRLVLRAGGAVHRVHEDQVREVNVPGDHPTFTHVYPGEPFYTSPR